MKDRKHERFSNQPEHRADQQELKGDMQKLLRWSLEKSDRETHERNEIAERVAEPDQKALNELFGGPNDATLMQAAAEILGDPKSPIPDKEAALQELQELVEDIDNAQGLESMHLWNHVLSQLQSPESSLRIGACYIIGTAVQNNAKGQSDLAKYPASFADLMALALDDPSSEVRTRALSALANAIRNCCDIYKLFDKANGWDRFAHLIPTARGDDNSLSRALSLYTALLSIPSIEDKIEKLRAYGILKDILDLLNTTDSHIIAEKTLHLFATENICLLLNFDEVDSLRKGIKHIQTQQVITSDDKALEDVSAKLANLP